MNVQDILRELDGFFRNGEYTKVEPFLLENLNRANAESDKAAALTLLNELMGFYRGMSRFQESLAVAGKALHLMEEMGFKGTVPYATTLLNVATAYRADGQTAKAIELFEEVGRIYTARRVNDAYLVASLYNNLSLAYQESDDHEKAIRYLEMALPLVKSLNAGSVEVAVTYTNLAVSKLKCQRFQEAREDLLKAVELFESQPHPTKNSHYGAALAALAEIAYRERNTPEAIALYERALAEIQSHYGKNLYYAVTLESLAVVYEDVDKQKSLALESEARAIRVSLK